MRFQPEDPGIGNKDRQQRKCQNLQHRGRAIRKRRIEPEMMHDRTAETSKNDGSSNSDPEGIGAAAAQYRAGFSDATIADGLGGHHLHPR